MLAQQGTGNQLQLLIVILPDVSGSYGMLTALWAILSVAIYLELCYIYIYDSTTFTGKIKRVCETEIGIVSQCCLPKHASRPNKQYLENVALKINVKVSVSVSLALSFVFVHACRNVIVLCFFLLEQVGGRNTVLERAFVRNGIPYVSEVPTIIFGADVTHPPPGEDSASSIAAVSFFL